MSKPKRVNKWEWIYVVQGWYKGTGWEDLCAAPMTREGRKESRDDLKAYRTNAPGTPYRRIKRRQLNPEWVAKGVIDEVLAEEKKI